MNDSDTEAETENGAIAQIVASHIKAQRVPISYDGISTEVLVLPTELEAHSLEEFVAPLREAPKRRMGTSNLVELASLIDLVNRFKDDDSALFASPKPAPTLLAVLDYHRRCNIIDEEDGETTQVSGDPRFGVHRARYAFPVSDEWTAWIAQNGKPMGQGDFAAWLEDRVLDVADPQQAFTSAKRFAEALGVETFASPSRLLSLSRGLSLHIDERVTNRINPNTGETTMLYESEHADASNIDVPRAFIIQVPVFRGGVAYQLPVRLKYRTGGGKIVWFYEVHDHAKAFDDAFREACEMAAEKTDLPLYYGSPETP